MPRNNAAISAGMKRQVLLGASIVAAVPSMVAAAPLPTAPPVYNWTGPYVGFAGGYAWGHSDHNDAGIPCTLFGSCGTTLLAPMTATGAAALSPAGGLFGGLAGYSWQAGSWVYGVEFDYFGGNVRGNSTSCGAMASFPHSCGTDLDSFGTARGRFGYAFNSTFNWLLYLTGGAAFGTITAWDDLLPASGSDFQTTWTMGGGVEAALMRNWSFKVEYIYVNFGNHQFFEIVPTVGEMSSLKLNLLRFGIIYRP